MTYFVSPYTSYYGMLSQSSNLSGTILSIANEVDNNSSFIGNLNSEMIGSKWYESGLVELTQNVLPSLKSNIDTLSKNIDNGLVRAISMAVNELLPKLSNLKQEDEKYDNNLSALRALEPVDRKDPGYNSYINRSYELGQKVNESKVKCVQYQKDCDSLVNSIKSLNSTVLDFSLSPFLGRSKIDDELKESIESGKILKVTYEGKEYYIANSEINCIEYEQYVQKYGLFQNGRKHYPGGEYGGICGENCDMLAGFYACDMLRGVFSDRKTMTQQKKGIGPNNRLKNTEPNSTSEDPDEVLRYVYDELLAGRPTILTVSQENTSIDGSRHFVTVVGFDASITSFEEFKANQDKILVLDCEDGKLQELGKPRSEGGHERTLCINQKGKYDARGATDTFKSDEIENEDWLNKNSDKRKEIAKKENENDNVTATANNNGFLNIRNNDNDNG